MVAWVRSRYLMDRIVVNSTRHYVEINLRRGGYLILWKTTERDGPLWVSADHDQRPPHGLGSNPYRWSDGHHLGFSYYEGERKLTGPPGTLPTWVFVQRWITVPYWVVTAVGLLLSTLLAARQVPLWRRRRRGLCVHCGYDLRASPGRCPECGSEGGRGSVSRSGAAAASPT
jgi:hypothetical protein